MSIFLYKIYKNMYTLKIDNREKDLIKIIPDLVIKEKLDKKINVEICPLDIGDFIVEDNKGNEVIIIERKSIHDLASSIQDGRYNEQSLRLSSLHIHNHNIIYLIEGNIENYYNKYSRVTKEALYSSLFSLNFYKGFSVFRSMNLNETAMLIVKSVKKLMRDTTKKGYYSQERMNENVDCHGKDNEEYKQNATTNYTDVVKRVKKDNIKPDNIGSIILSQIPGISATLSKVIMDKYGSLYELMMKMHETPDLLKNETYVTSKGQTRRISHKCIQSIQDYLLYKRENVIIINTEQ